MIRPHCNVKDLTGQTFGNLNVIGFAGTNKHRKALWKVRNTMTDAESVVLGASLTDGSAYGARGVFYRNSYDKTNYRSVAP